MRNYIIGSLLLINSIFTFATDEYYIKKIEFKGLSEVPKSTILRKVKYKEGALYSEDGILSIYDELSKNKYLEKVTIHSEEYNGGIKLIVDVKEKENIKELLEKDGILPISERESIDTSLVIDEVEIFGNSNISSKEIAKIIGIKKGEYLSRNKLRKAREKLLDTGLYRDVKYDAYTIGGDVTISFIIEENPIIDDVDIAGNTKFTTEELKKLINIEEGKLLNWKNLREASNKILEKYNEKGYVLAKITDVNVVEGSKLLITISEGMIDNIRFSKMITKQRSGRRSPSDTIMKTKDYVIEREIEMESNQVFDINKYNETVSNLMRTGYFKNVKYELRNPTDGSDGTELVLLLEEERTASLQASLSYGSEIGFLGTLALKDMNWMGKGQNVGVTFEKSDKDYTSFSLEFSDPWIRGTDRVSWGWNLYKTQYENDDSILFYDTDIYGIKADIGRGLNKYVRFGLGAKAEYVIEKPNSTELEGAIKNSSGEYKSLLESKRGKEEYGLFTIFPSIIYDSRNNYWNPTAGGYAKVQVEVGYTTLKDAKVFGNATVEFRKYHRGFFSKNTFTSSSLRDLENTFAYRLVGGVMTTSTPESQRFWVGGGSTLRGYDGGYFQGTRKLTFTVENRTKINDILGFVVFSDMGRAWQYRGIDPGYLRLGRDREFPSGFAYTAGVGLRINTPVGPLRFDFGWPIGDKNNKDMQFYFSMGQSF